MFACAAKTVLGLFDEFHSELVPVQLAMPGCLLPWTMCWCCVRVCFDLTLVIVRLAVGCSVVSLSGIEQT